MPSIIWCFGSGIGTVAGIATGNAGNRIVDSAQTAAVTSSNPRSGTYSLNLAGTSAARSITLDANTLGTPTAVVANFWIMFPSLPAATIDFCIFQTDQVEDAYFSFDQALGKLTAGWSSQAAIAGPTISANTWYNVDLMVDQTTTTNRISWKVDGVAQTDTTITQGVGMTQAWIVGRINSVTGTMQADDMVVSVTAADYPLGQHKVVVLTPDQAGTITVNGSTANWNTFAGATPTETAWNAATALAAIDEIPLTLNTNADGIGQVARTDSTHYIEIPMTSYTLAGGETVSGARMLAAGWAATTTAATIGFRSYNGTTETTLFAAGDPNFDNSTTTPAWVCKMLTLADVDTQAELNALAFRVGFSSDVSPHIGIHAIYAEVAIKQAPVAPSVVAAVAAIPAPTVSTPTGGDATVTASAVAAVAAVGSPTLAAGTSLTASVVAATSTVGSPTLAAGSTVTPTSVAATAAVGVPTVSTGSAIAATAVAGTAGVGTPTLSAGAGPTPATTVVTTVVGTPALSTGVTLTLTTVAGVAAIAAPTVTTVSIPQPATVGAIATVGTPTVAAGTTVTLATVAGVAAIASPTIEAGATAEPATVSAAASIGTASVAVGSAVATGTIAAVASIGTPTVTATNPITLRPNAGTTNRPTSGTTARPDLGVTSRP